MATKPINNTYNKKENCTTKKTGEHCVILINKKRLKYYQLRQYKCVVCAEHGTHRYKTPLKNQWNFNSPNEAIAFFNKHKERKLKKGYIISAIGNLDKTIEYLKRLANLHEVALASRLKISDKKKVFTESKSVEPTRFSKLKLKE